jgi:hypothetical protein
MFMGCCAAAGKTITPRKIGRLADFLDRRFIRGLRWEEKKFNAETQRAQSSEEKEKGARLGRRPLQRRE